MDSTFGAFDAFAFVVMAALVITAVVVVVNLGRLPGQLARKWEHPQASAINAMSWIGIATGGLLWPIAFVWAFTNSWRSEPAAIGGGDHSHNAGRLEGVLASATASGAPSGEKGLRP
jgi:hypothetical protein